MISIHLDKKVINHFMYLISAEDEFRGVSCCRLVCTRLTQTLITTKGLQQNYSITTVDVSKNNIKVRGTL